MSYSSVPQVRVHKSWAGRDKFRDALAARIPFATSGSLQGLLGRDWFGTGRLNKLDSERLYDARDQGALGFVVYSYATPIFWYITKAVKHGDGTRTRRGWHQTAQKFSVTTSKQQGAVGGALAIAGIEVQ